MTEGSDLKHGWFNVWNHSPAAFNIIAIPRQFRNHSHTLLITSQTNTSHLKYGTGGLVESSGPRRAAGSSRLHTQLAAGRGILDFGNIPLFLSSSRLFGFGKVVYASESLPR